MQKYAYARINDIKRAVFTTSFQLMRLWDNQTINNILFGWSGFIFCEPHEICSMWMRRNYVGERRKKSRNKTTDHNSSGWSTCLQIKWIEKRMRTTTTDMTILHSNRDFPSKLIRYERKSERWGKVNCISLLLVRLFKFQLIPTKTKENVCPAVNEQIRFVVA